MNMTFSEPELSDMVLQLMFFWTLYIKNGLFDSLYFSVFFLMCFGA